MFTLILDTSTEKGIVAVSEKEHLLFEKHLYLKAIKGSLLLTTSVNEAFLQLGIEGRDLKAIAVGVGPGSFTGIRVAAAFAKGLAISLNIPIISFSTLLGFMTYEEGDFYSVIPTRVGGSYVLHRRCHQGEVEELSLPQFISVFKTDHRVVSSEDHNLSGLYLAKMVEKRFFNQQFSLSGHLDIDYLIPFKLG